MITLSIIINYNHLSYIHPRLAFPMSISVMYWSSSGSLLSGTSFNVQWNDWR